MDISTYYVYGYGGNFRAKVSEEPVKTPSLRKRGKSTMLSVPKFKLAAYRVITMVEFTKLQVINF